MEIADKLSKKKKKKGKGIHVPYTHPHLTHSSIHFKQVVQTHQIIQPHNHRIPYAQTPTATAIHTAIATATLPFISKTSEICILAIPRLLQERRGCQVVSGDS